MFHTLCRIALLATLTLPVAATATPVVLRADGVSPAYSLINRTLGGNAVEAPDCGHSAFGPHIRQIADRELGKPVFEFHLHVQPDNDRCSKFDRQRIEIKTYGKSPDYLVGRQGETVNLRWRFRLDADFRATQDFTHIHQIKAGDGDDDKPIITITPRAGKGDVMQVQHDDSRGHKAVLASVPLAPFKGVWVEAYERLTYGERGRYALVLTRVSDGAVLLQVNDTTLDLWRDGTSFVRPKWGIYRSLKHPDQLRDEMVRFDEFCLSKAPEDCARGGAVGARGN